MKMLKALLFSLMASSAFAAGGIGIIQGDAVTFSSAVITGNISMNGTCTGTGCGGGGGSSSLGVNYGGVSVTTPTAQINFVGPLRATANTSTATITIDPISLSTAVTGTLPVANGGTGTATPNLVAGTNITSITGTWPNQTINAATQAGGAGGASSLGVNFNGVSITTPTAQINFVGANLSVTAIGSTATVTLSQVSLSSGVTGLLPVANGGSGTASPGLIAGTNITSVTGTWPNQTINATTQGGGGGASTLGVNYLGVSITSPTAQINFTGPGVFVSATGSTSTVVISSWPAGVPSINSQGNSAITSSATLVAGTNMTLSQLGNTITVNSTAGGNANWLDGNSFYYQVTSSTGQVAQNVNDAIVFAQTGVMPALPAGKCFKWEYDLISTSTFNVSITPEVFYGVGAVALGGTISGSTRAHIQQQGGSGAVTAYNAYGYICNLPGTQSTQYMTSYPIFTQTGGGYSESSIGTETASGTTERITVGLGSATNSNTIYVTLFRAYSVGW